MTRPDLPALTGLRFVAALFVLIAHVAVQSGPLPAGFYVAPLTIWATVGMVLFFTLSGFIIHYSYAHILWGRDAFLAGVRHFAAARFARLYPLYLACLVLAVLRSYAPVIWQTKDGAVAAALHIFSLQNWFFTALDGLASPDRIYPVAWSISTEMFFYVAFPVVCWPFVRWVRSVWGALVAWLCVVVLGKLYTDYVGLVLTLDTVRTFITFGHEATTPPGIGGWFLHFSPFGRLFEFILGVATAHIFLVLRERAPNRRDAAIGGVLLLMGVLSMLALLVLCYEPTLRIFSDGTSHFVLAPSIAVVIFCLARYHSSVSALLSCPWALKLGDASYSIYLLHPFVIALLVRPSYIDAIPVGKVEYLIRAIAMVCVTLFLALVCYVHFEKPARLWIRDKLRARTDGAATASAHFETVK